MHYFLRKFLYIAIVLCCLTTPISAKTVHIPESNVDIYFSPKGGALKGLVTTLNNAQHEILVMAYSFTSEPIAQAIVAAMQRGVKVEIIIDKSQLYQKKCVVRDLALKGAIVKVDCTHAIAHQKVMLVDDHIVAFGSFNFSNAAEESNSDNLNIFPIQPIYDTYYGNYAMHYWHALQLKDMPATAPSKTKKTKKATAPSEN